MKNVSTNFLNKVKSSVKQIDADVLFAWDKKIDDSRAFFTLDTSALDGPDILWNGNQQTIAFMDRYEYTSEKKNLKSWQVSRKVSNHPWGVISSTATVELNNASGRYYQNSTDPNTKNILIDGYELDAYNAYLIAANSNTLSVASGTQKPYTLLIDCEPNTLYRITKSVQASNNVLRVGTNSTALPEGGTLNNVVRRDDYDEVLITTGANDHFMYIYYASNTANAHEALETLTIKPVLLTNCNLPNRPVKIQVGIDGESINVFTGYTSRPEISITNSTFKVTAYDAMSYLSTVTSDLTAIVSQPLDVIIEALLLEAGFTSDQFVLEAGVQLKIDYVSPKGRNVANLLDELCAAEQYLLFADGDGIIHGWNANHYEVRNGSEVWQTDFDNATELGWGSTSVLNDVKVKATPYRIVPTSKFFATSDPTEDYLVPSDGTMTLWLDLVDADGNKIYAIDFDEPVENSNVGSNFTTNTDMDGSGPDTSGIVEVIECLNFGDSVKITFDNPSGLDIYVTSVALVGTSAQKKEFVGIEAYDAESIEDYGVNPDESEGEIYNMESNFIQNEDFATTIATRVVELYAQPQNKIETSIFFAPQLEIGDQIKVVVGRFGTKNTLLFGMDLSGDSEGSFKQKIYLEERPNITYFHLDSSKLNGPDVLAI